MIAACWILTIAAAVLGGLLTLDAIVTSDANSAPQTAAKAALAAAITIVPYVLARAAQSLAGDRQLRQLNESLATHTRLLAEIANQAGPAETHPDPPLQ